MNERGSMSPSASIRSFHGQGSRKDITEALLEAIKSYETENMPIWEQGFTALRARDHESFRKGVTAGVTQVFVDILCGTLTIEAGGISEGQAQSDEET